MNIRVVMNSFASHDSHWLSPANAARLPLVAIALLLIPAPIVWPCEPDCCEDTPGCNCEEVCSGYDCAGQSEFCNPRVCDPGLGLNGECVDGIAPSLSITVDNTVYLCWWTRITITLTPNDSEMPDEVRVDFETGNDRIFIDGSSYVLFTPQFMSTHRWVRGYEAGPSSIRAYHNCAEGGTIETTVEVTVEKQEVTLDLKHGGPLYQNQELQLDVGLTQAVPPVNGDTLKSDTGSYRVSVSYDREVNTPDPITYWPGGALFRQPDCGDGTPGSCNECNSGSIYNGVTFESDGPSSKTFYYDSARLAQDSREVKPMVS